MPPPQGKGVCRYFATTGSCAYGNQCVYSHSLTEESVASADYVPKSQRPCRNIATYGYCKYQGKDCEFNHDFRTVASEEDVLTPLPADPQPSQIQQQPPLPGPNLQTTSQRSAAPQPMHLASSTGFLPPVERSPYDLPHTTAPDGRVPLSSFFMSDKLRFRFKTQKIEMLKSLTQEDPLFQTLPQMNGKFHSLMPLDDLSRTQGTIGGHRTTLFKGSAY